MRQGAGHYSVPCDQGAPSGDLCRCKDQLHFPNASELWRINKQGWVFRFLPSSEITSILSDRGFRNFRDSASRDFKRRGGPAKRGSSLSISVQKLELSPIDRLKTPLKPFGNQQGREGLPENLRK